MVDRDTLLIHLIRQTFSETCPRPTVWDTIPTGQRRHPKVGIRRIPTDTVGDTTTIRSLIIYELRDWKVG
jgi:hypothetical protein